MTWEISKKLFINRFFPKEKRESKVEEFINLHQGGMSVLDYFLKFTKLSKYAPSLVSNPRDEMSCFVIGISDDLKEECSLAMLHDNMNIFHLMVHAQQVEETRVKRKSRDTKRARSFEGGSSKGRLDIQDYPRFKNRTSNQVPSKFPNARYDRVSNPNSQKGIATTSQKGSELVESVARVDTRLGISQI